MSYLVQLPNLYFPDTQQVEIDLVWDRPLVKSIRFRTEYRTESFEASVPRFMAAIVQGEAASVHQAALVSSIAVERINGFIAFLANVSVPRPWVRLAADTTEDVPIREFIQNEFPPIAAWGAPTVRVDGLLLLQLVNVMNQQQQADRDSLGSVFHHYNRALSFAAQGEESRLIAEAFAGIDGLLKMTVAAECRSRGVSEASFKSALGAKDQNGLRTAVLRDVNFEGDAAAYDLCRRIRNATFHGDLSDVCLQAATFALACQALRYLRRSIVRCFEPGTYISSELMEALRQEVPYRDVPGRPLPLESFEAALRGDFATDDFERIHYSVLNFRRRIKTCTRTDDGFREFTFEVEGQTNADIVVTEGSRLHALALEMYAAQGTPPQYYP